MLEILKRNIQNCRKLVKKLITRESDNSLDEKDLKDLLGVQNLIMVKLKKRTELELLLD